jgi:hypothetical protein
MIKEILARFPEPTGHGVYHPLEDGSIVPWRWYDSIKKLEQLEAKEKELLMREQIVREREEALGPDQRPAPREVVHPSSYAQPRTLSALQHPIRRLRPNSASFRAREPCCNAARSL